jgi:tRNA dimethylallyltransferase
MVNGAPRGVLAILGATATGKSALAVEVADRLGGEVISADAFTVYRGFDAGTAKPSLDERRGVPHHLIDVKEPTEFFSAGEFARKARAAAEEILARGKLPVLSGGTGFYVRSFFDGLFEGPERQPGVRAALEAVRARRGADFLVRAARLLDPAAAARLSPRDAARAVRILEIVLATGRRPSALFVERPGKGWERESVKVLLTLPREVLYGRIEARFYGTFLTTLPEEVQGLLASGVPLDAPAFAAIGYRDTADYVSGSLGRSEWEGRILRDTRRYAKRQETWFRSEEGLIPIRADREDLADQVVAHARRLFFSFQEGGAR